MYIYYIKFHIYHLLDNKKTFFFLILICIKLKIYIFYYIKSKMSTNRVIFYSIFIIYFFKKE